MNKFVTKIAFLCGILSSLVLMPATSFAIDFFNTETGFLVIPEVDVNGDTFYDDVTLKLDFATGTFEFVGATAKPESISATPIDTTEEQDIKMDFMGCTRSGRNEITCHLKLTSLGGLDRNSTICADGNRSFTWCNGTYVFDDLGNSYLASQLSIANKQVSNAVDVLLVAGVPTLAKFKFINISPNAASLSLFKPEFKSGNSFEASFYGDFRNINF